MGIKFSARNYGIILLAYGVGTILANVISVFANDLFGSYLEAFVPADALVVIIIFIAFFMMKPPGKGE